MIPLQEIINLVNHFITYKFGVIFFVSLVFASFCFLTSHFFFWLVFFMFFFILVIHNNQFYNQYLFNLIVEHFLEWWSWQFQVRFYIHGLPPRRLQQGRHLHSGWLESAGYGTSATPGTSSLIAIAKNSAGYRARILIFLKRFY